MDTNHELVEENDSNMDELFGEVLEGLPREKRDKIEKTIVSQFAMISRISPEGEIAAKITEKHISQHQENQAKAMEYTHKDEVHKKVFMGFVIVLVICAVFGVIILLKEMPETMERIVSVLITAVISGAGGYGFGKSRGKEDS